MFAKIIHKIRLFMVRNKEPYFSLYKILGFIPNNISIYKQAFVHKSSSIIDTERNRKLNNERLEFLGDAILDSIISDIVFNYFPHKKEGFLTNMRSKIVQRESLNDIAIKMGIDKLLINSSKSSSHNNYIYGNAVEALIGAIYIDKGYDVCFRFVKERIIEEHFNLDKLSKKEVNFKSNLIEWSQKNRLEVNFELIESFTDPEGNPVFQSSVTLCDTQLGIGIGYSKKESQQAASKMAIKKIRNDKETQLWIEEQKKKLTENTDSALEDLPEEEEDVSDKDSTDSSAD